MFWFWARVNLQPPAWESTGVRVRTRPVMFSSTARDIERLGILAPFADHGEADQVFPDASGSTFEPSLRM